MARGRIVSTEVTSDPELNRLSPDAERLYLRTLPHLDRDGLISGVPMLVWATAAPLRVELMDKAPALIDEWVTQSLVMRYDGADGPVLFFKGFRRHQANLPYAKEAPSRFPPPPGWHRARNGMIPDDPDLCRALAEKFDPRSAYRKELERVASPSQAGRDQVESRSRPGRDEVQVEVEVQDEVQDEQFDDDDGEPFAPPLDVLKEENATRARVSRTSGRTGDGQQAHDTGQLRAWCLSQVDELLPDWLGAARRIEQAGVRELVALSTWLWAYRHVRKRGAYGTQALDFPDHFDGVENPAGKIIVQALEYGNVYPLGDAVGELNRAIELYGNAADVLFGPAQEGEASPEPVLKKSEGQRRRGASC